MKTGLYIGRFQPFHLGHLSAIKQALKNVDFLTIGIGSAQYSRKNNNPFTAKERITMIENALKANKVPKSQYKIVLIPDIHNNEKWTDHVRSIVHEFDILFLGNKGIVKELFEKYNPVKTIFVKHETPISGTEIRGKINEGTDCEKYLDKTTVEYLEKI